MRYLPYVLTLLTSSTLLFVVQPMVGRMIQPVLGGTPAVWNTALLFFQALLLAGYIYAHLTTRWLGTRRQALLHLVVMFVGLLFLPIAFEAPTDPTSLEQPILWIIAALGIGVGWPFFVVSTSAPLLQKWFSTIDHRHAADPYHLYAASNAGSLLALVAYPLIIEPNIGLDAQATLWTVAYLVLCSAVALCAAVLWSSPARDDEGDDGAMPPRSGRPVCWKRRARWVTWAFIPSSLMLAVTTRITTEIAPVPLLWLPPLALYLLSFIFAFSRQSWVPDGLCKWSIAPALVVGGLLVATDARAPLFAVTAAYLGVLFAVSIVVHGLLAEDRPHTEALTEFYCWISVGGVLGGLFNALLAPVVFDRLLETPLTLAVAALAIPASLYTRRAIRGTVVIALIAAGIGIALGIDNAHFDDLWGIALLAVLALAIAAVAIRFPRTTGVAIAAAMAIVSGVKMVSSSPALLQERSFFGTHRVEVSADQNYHVLYHGQTIHGAQARPQDLRQIPLTYYYVEGPLGEVFEVLNERPPRHPVAAIGLGTGSIASYTAPQQRMDFFEIDPVVASIANDEAYFDYLHDCPGDCRVTIGDGRQLIEAADDNQYELVVVDAFSSSAIPLHLLTREAVESYLHAIRPDGIVAIHISSPHFNLEAPLAQIADDLGIAARIQRHQVDDSDPLYDYFINSSEWVVIAGSDAAVGAIADSDDWERLESPDELVSWTDDYANLVDILR